MIALTALSFSLIFSAANAIRGFAWDPSEGKMQDLDGTESSCDYNVAGDARRFDIYTENTRGIQVGEDDDSIAFRIKLAPLIEVTGEALLKKKRAYYGFLIDNMTSGDQYEVRFSIGDLIFSILFTAIGGASGTCRLYYYNTTVGSWASSASLTAENIKSGKTYSSPGREIGFNLEDATKNKAGLVKFIIGKNHLYNLGARGNLVMDIYAIALADGNGLPGGDVETPNDRCPASGYASWTLQGDIPDLPAGIIVLTAPLIAVYAYFRCSRKPFIVKPSKPAVISFSPTMNELVGCLCPVLGFSPQPRVTSIV